MPVITDLDLLKNRRTKIVATLGPASNDEDVIRALIVAGVNIVRLNMSHGDHEFHRRLFGLVRSVADELGLHVGVLADLSGPKIRVGKFANGEITLDANAEVVITTREVIGEPGLIPSQYEALHQDVHAGDRVLLNDGALELSVVNVADTEITCKVVTGGPLSDHKGINLPGVKVSAPALTDKDRADAKFALKLGVDFVALSFVRTAKEINDLRDLATQEGFKTTIVAKIEKPEALENSVEIIEAADAIMIARGDLGVELNPEQVPVAQHQLIDRARASNKPVIVATQMLESMIDNPRPTRAEVTDVSHAVSLGADAVMLSGETAAGAHPVETVEIMVRIAKQTEAFFWRKRTFVRAVASGAADSPVPFGDAVAEATAQLAHDLHARAVVVVSHGGMSAATISAARPAAPIFVISGTAAACRRMNLMWGIVPILSNELIDGDPNAVARQIASDHKLADVGQFILLVRGFSPTENENNPSITVLRL